MSQTVSFTADGPGFTNLLRDFTKEGRFGAIYQIMTDSNPDVTNDIIISFLTGQSHFTGIASQESDMYISKTGEIANYQNLSLGIRHILKRRTELSADKDYLALKKIFGGEFPKELKHKILEESGFIIAQSIRDNQFSGVITHDGTIVQCGYQEHRYLYHVLRDVGYANTSNWVDDLKCIHISSGEVSGKVSASIKHVGLYDVNITNEMLTTLWKNCDNLRFYESFDNQNMGKIVFDYFKDYYKLGGKLSNLYFLKEIYPDVNLPKFSLKKIPGVKNCIRTSPKYSLPGLLNSKFDINENSLKEIWDTWEKYRDVRGTFKNYKGETVRDNELTVFYQEFIKGINGVCQLIDGKFKIGSSKVQGDIVLGLKNSAFITNQNRQYLENLLREISRKTASDVQIEFVEDNGLLYIVQLRLLNKSSNNEVIPPDGEILAKGKSFSYGIAEDVKIEDILFIESDAISEDVIGKKAVIVFSDAEFSHALALSRALGIPSLFGTGKIPIPENVETITINTTDKIGYIS